MRRGILICAGCGRESFASPCADCDEDLALDLLTPSPLPAIHPTVAPTDRVRDLVEMIDRRIPCRPAQPNNDRNKEIPCHNR